jgi:hypothetical protein
VNADGKADIAVGAPYETTTLPRRGVVHIFDGASGTLLRTIERPGLETFAFGFSLAMADSNADGKADLAVGSAEWPDFSPFNQGGSAYLFDGATGSLLRSFRSPQAKPQGSFGWAVALGDVNGDGNTELAVGAPHEGPDNQGRAYLLSTQTGEVVIELAAASPSTGLFGSALAAGDVTGDGKAEVVASAPQALVGNSGAQGRAYLFSASGLLATLDTPNGQSGAGFGEWITIGDVDGNRRRDIIIGAPFEDVADRTDEGRAYVFCFPDCSPLPAAFPATGSESGGAGNYGAPIAISLVLISIVAPPLVLRRWRRREPSL